MDTADDVDTAPIQGGLLVGYDGSRGACLAVEWAIRVAERTDWTLHVLRAWTLTTAPRPKSMTGGYVPPASEFGDAVLEQLQADRDSWDVPDGVRIELHVAQGQSSAQLLKHAREVDLLVVGARGAGGFRGLHFGSTADQVVRNSPVPVVVVPVHKD